MPTSVLMVLAAQRSLVYSAVCLQPKLVVSQRPLLRCQAWGVHTQHLVHTQHSPLPGLALWLVAVLQQVSRDMHFAAQPCAGLICLERFDGSHCGMYSCTEACAIMLYGPLHLAANNA